MTVYTFDENTVSDLHKDARGCRPGSSWWQTWNSLGDEQKQNVWEDLCEELEAEMNRERQAQERAVLEMHQRVQGLMLLGAKDEIQAIQWLMEAEGFDESDLRYGPSYFCFRFNLPYSAENDFPVTEAINEMLSETV
jgi:predicted Fe-S protein YdhL (DUF1289 family)